jgi:hypothetical protein
MRLFIYFFILLSFPLVSLADPQYDDQCLFQFEAEENAETRQRLIVVKTHKIDNLIINFYGTPIWRRMYPHTEGCEDEDGKILIYDKKTQKTLYHKSENAHAFAILKEKYEIEPYKNIFTQNDSVNLIIRHGYMANCGGCHSILFFKTEPEFLYLGKLYFNPAKYKFEGLPSYREYNIEDKLVKEHFILDPKDEWFDPRSYYKR